MPLIRQAHGALTYARLAGITLLLSTYARASLLPVSFFPPLNHFSPDGSRQIQHWLKHGSTQLTLSGVSLAREGHAASHGSLFTATDAKVGIKGEEGASITFRVSTKGTRKEVGGSLGFFSVRSDEHVTGGNFYGISEYFIGIAVIVDFNNIDDNRTEEVIVFSNDGSPFPKMLASCSIDLLYDQNRHDSDHLAGSSLRLLIEDGSVKVDVDPRNKGKWVDCIDVQDASISPKRLKGGKLGIVATNHNKRASFEVTRVAVYNSVAEVLNDTFVDEYASRPVQILHMLEHELFDINEKLRSATSALQSKVSRELFTIQQIESRWYEHFLGSLDGRVEDLEKGILNGVAPWVKGSTMHVQQIYSDNLETLELNMKQPSDWIRPFFLILVFLVLVMFFERKEYRRLKKLSSKYM